MYLFIYVFIILFIFLFIYLFIYLSLLYNRILHFGDMQTLSSPRAVVLFLVAMKLGGGIPAVV